MVRFSEIQQFPDFLKLFQGNFRTICPRFENSEILGQIVSALYFKSKKIQIPLKKTEKDVRLLGRFLT